MRLKEVKGKVETLNNMDFMLMSLEGASRAFIQDASEMTGLVADIGCAFGVATHEVLKVSRCDVMAVDLLQAHLDILKSEVEPKHLSRLQCVAASFPSGLEWTDEQLSAAHASLVIPFLSGLEIDRDLANFMRHLSPVALYTLMPCRYTSRFFQILRGSIAKELSMAIVGLAKSIIYRII